MSRSAEYEEKKWRIVHEFKKNLGNPVSLNKKTSNLFRNREISRFPRLDVKHFNRVLSLDPVQKIAEVEAMITFEDLVNETLQHNCLPPVVPELKTITVGGALVGLGIESSSFRYGLVHETIFEIEVLTGEGSVITARADNEYRDLFFAFPNSYGSLGIALKVKMRLIHAAPFVKLTNLHFSDEKAFFKKMEELCTKERFSANDSYVDGVIFSPKEQVIVHGEFVQSAPYLNNYTYLNIYYESIRKQKENFLTAHDYIWRWDADWFWCSKHFGMQNSPLRFLLGKWMLHSSVYWKIKRLAFTNPLLKAILKVFEKPSESVIQDIIIPIQNAPRFAEFLHESIGITPIWICPYFTKNREGKYPLCEFDPEQFYVDFGFWDLVPSQKPKGHFNRLIEKKTGELKGYKSLYSDSYYSEEEFWQIHPKYPALKKKHDPQKSFKDLYEKCVGKPLSSP